MPPIVNLSDFIKVGLMAFVFVKLFDAFLRKAGANQYTISGE